MLPSGQEPEIIHAAIPAEARILELGAGAGRITHPLLRLGHPVVAVDDSPALLAHVHDAQTVASTIEALELGEAFPVVVLGSHLINVPDSARRAAFLRCCRRHLRGDGCLLIERHAPEWFDTATDSEHAGDGIIYRLRDIRRPEIRMIAATMEYEIDGRVWTQSFCTSQINDEQLAKALRDAGLQLDTTLTKDRSWVCATAAPQE